MLLPRDLRRLRGQTEVQRKDSMGRMRKKAMSIREVGEAMGLSFQRIGQWEIGDGAPDPLQMMQLLKLYAANGSEEAAEIVKLGGPKKYQRPSVVLTPKLADLLKSLKFFIVTMELSNTSLRPEVERAKISVTNALQSCITGLTDEDRQHLEGWL
jgi:transcriptional regulator with XRE-family HTH domain